MTGLVFVEANILNNTVDARYHDKQRRAAVAEPAASHGESDLRPLPRHRARGRQPKRRAGGGELR